MAAYPPWTRNEWALVVDLVARFRGDVPAFEVERTHYLLRAAGLTSEDPIWRRRAADPSFRSLGSVWAQYHHVRRNLRATRREAAPTALAAVWREFDRDPESVSLIAQPLRERVSSEANPYGVKDEASLRVFLTDLGQVLGEVVEVLSGLPAPRASPELISAHASAWAELRGRDTIPFVLSQLEEPEAAASLEAVGLTGDQLRFKLTGWLGALTEWRDERAFDALIRALRWANLVLGSLGQALAGPGADALKEFKEGTEAVLDEATPPRGYLPAPAYG